MNTSLPLLLPIICLFALPCCRPPQQAYYASPVHGYANEYHPLPQVTDSAHTGYYAEAGFFTGNVNTNWHDNVKALHSSFTIAHHTGMLQVWGGGDLSLGSYHMGQWDTSDVRTYPVQTTVLFNPQLLNSYTGNHFFGALGLHGGANIVVPMNSGEWRVFGLEGSVNHYFGQYRTIRQKLPDTAASIIARGSMYGTLGFSSELIGSTKLGEFGFRGSLGWVLGDPYANTNVYDYKSGHYMSYSYVCLTTHYTREQYTLYGQLNFATKTAGISFGLAYRLNKPRNAPAQTSHRREALYKQ